MEPLIIIAFPEGDKDIGAFETMIAGEPGMIVCVPMRNTEDGF